MKAVLFVIAISACAQSPQNPSPMVEHTRSHQLQIEPPLPDVFQRLLHSLQNHAFQQHHIFAALGHR